MTGIEGQVAGGVAPAGPGVQATGTGRQAIAGTSAVIALESLFQGPAGRGVRAGALAVVVADMAGGPFR